MKNRHSENPIPWDILILHLKGESTAADEQRLAEWTAQGENAFLLEELTDLWDKIQQNAGNYRPDTSYYWNELSRRLHLSEATGQPAPPQPPTKVRRLSWQQWTAAACAGLLIALSFFVGGRWASQPDVTLQYANLSGKSQATLPDRSQVWLHTRTTLQCDITPSVQERRIRLEGEAFFDVTHDSERPFIVQTGDLLIRVHGTRFNVEAFPEDENIYVSLEQGSVSVNTPTAGCFLHPGETATYNKQSHSLQITSSDIAFTTSWMKDELLFEQRSLADICHSLERWYHVSISLHPAIAQAYRFTFSLRNESLEDILRLMSSIHPIGYTFYSSKEVSIYPLTKQQ